MAGKSCTRSGAGTARRALLGFAGFGLFWGAWGAALPQIQAHAGATDAQLGLALLCIGAGALCRCGRRARWSTASGPA